MILYNPHVDDFVGDPVQFLIFGRRPLKKYGFLLSEPVKRNLKVQIYKDSSMSCILPLIIFVRLPKFLRFLITEFEFRIWLYLNKLNKDHYIRLNSNGLKGKILITFSYKSATGLFQERKQAFTKCKYVIFHLSHYFVNTKLKSENISQCSNSILAGDSDITNNSYYQKHFGWYKKNFYVLHFAVQSRFKKYISFSEKFNGGIATGSFHRLSECKPANIYMDFINHFQRDSYHLLREEIHAADIDPKTLKSYVSLYNEPSKLGEIKKFFNVSSQKKYFSLDIVHEYNKYKYAIVGEELSGFPAIGAFEAMACGCILIAKEKYYRGLGFEPNLNFLTYDGSLSDFLKVLEDASGNSRMSEMSEASIEYIDKRFRENIVYDSWVKKLGDLHSEVIST